MSITCVGENDEDFRLSVREWIGLRNYVEEFDVYLEDLRADEDGLDDVESEDLGKRLQAAIDANQVPAEIAGTVQDFANFLKRSGGFGICG